MTKKRSRTKHVGPSEGRLTAEARELRRQAAQLPPGSERDRLLRKAKHHDTSANMTAWINSPGLRPPEQRRCAWHGQRSSREVSSQ
jgi:hypothetical protein